MLHARRDDPNLPDRSEANVAGLTAQFRLFGLLALLVPLFAGLQLVVREGVPRVEVRLVPQDVQTTVPVEVPVERVVERIVYVAADGSEVPAPNRAVDPGASEAPSAVLPVTESAVEPRGEPGDVAASDPADTEESGAVAIVDEPADVPPLAGVVAVVPPPPPVVPRALPVVQQTPLAPSAESAAEEPAADEGAATVADAPDEAADEEPVAEAPVEETPVVATERVALYSSEAPMVREDGGPSIGMLRHDLYVSVPKPQAAPAQPSPEQEKVAPAPEEASAGEAGEPAVADDASDADNPAPAEAAELVEQTEPLEGMEPSDAAESPEAIEPADTSDAEASTNEAEEATDREASAEPEHPEAVATRTTESLLAEAEVVRVDMVDPGANNGPAIATIEHTLIARPATPEPEREAEAAPEHQEPVPVVASEAIEEVAEPVAEAPSDADEAGEPQVASTERRQGELAIVGDDGTEDDAGQ